MGAETSVNSLGKNVTEEEPEKHTGFRQGPSQCNLSHRDGFLLCYFLHTNRGYQLQSEYVNIGYR